MNRIQSRILLPVLLACWQLTAAVAPAQTTNARPFEPEILAFEAADKTSPPPHGGIVFTGSSSIRKWTTLERDFPAHKVINRGSGGSQLSDAILYADRIVIPYQPRQVMLFAGSNDLDAGKTPEQVLADFKTFVQKVRAKLPGVEIDFIAITTSPLRWAQVEKVRKANAFISAWIPTQEHLVYIDVFPATLGANGQPRQELFLADRLHMNPQGYVIWTKIIGPYLK